MTGDNYQTYLGLVGKMSVAGQSPTLTPSEQGLLSQLEYGLFMYPDHRDEFEAIKFQHELAKYDMTRLMLVLAPTLACNMACPYCYEGNKQGKMSPEVAGQILRFVEQKAASLSRLEVLWYGGEPLLAFDLLEELNLALIKLAGERQFEYTTGIVTNGYSLTPEVVDKLAVWKTVLCQVTIDGPARLHNQKRPLKNGRESFPDHHGESQSRCHEATGINQGERRQDL